MAVRRLAALAEPDAELRIPGLKSQPLAPARAQQQRSVNGARDRPLAKSIRQAQRSVTTIAVVEVSHRGLDVSVAHPRLHLDNVCDGDAIAEAKARIYREF